MAPNVCFKLMDCVLSFNILKFFTIRPLIYENFKIIVFQLKYYYSDYFNHFEYLFRLLMFNYPLYEI
jgi:hypothetical protein